MDTEAIKRKIERAIPGARAQVTGADAHFAAVVVAEAFAGKTRIEQHQMIYALFREEMARQEIHALSIRTTTPAPPGRPTDPTTSQGA